MGLLFQNITTDVITFVAILTVFLLIYAKHLLSYWTRLGVKTLKPTFPFGNFNQSFFMKRTLGEVVADYYSATTEPYAGLYAILRPVLLVRDTELIQKIFIKDFQHFTDRGVHCDEEYDPLSGHLFALRGQKWRNLRNKLSPTFTSGKLKAMFSTIISCGKSLEEHLEHVAQKNETLEVREIAARFTTNVIASIAFGIDINCFANPNTEFREYGKKSLELNLKRGLFGLLNFVLPSALKYIKIRSVEQDVENFFKSIVKQNLEYREQNNVTRKDFFQLLVQLRNSGNVQLDDEWKTVINNEDQKTLSLNQITAQAFVFYVAGFETSSSTTFFCMYELAKNPEIQQKVQEEIDAVLNKHGGELTYDAVNEMKYLECCIDETLRMYPIVPFLTRECTKEYTISGTKIIIEKGMQAYISLLGLHYDEKYYEEPMKFKPERFNEENSIGKNIINRPYFPFGDGPRICIGMRLGKLQTKIGLLLMLKNYTYKLREQNIRPIYAPTAVLLTPINDIQMQMQQRIPGDKTTERIY